MLPLLRHLSPAEAVEYLKPYQARLDTPDPKAGVEVDSVVLTSGWSSDPGARLYAPGRLGQLDLPPEGVRSSIFIDGDLKVDDVFLNFEGIVFVRGDLEARTILTYGYLIVLGAMRVQRFLGAFEEYGTHVLGGVTAEDFLLYDNHNFFGDVSATFRSNAEPDAIDTVREWGVPADGGSGDQKEEEAHLPHLTEIAEVLRGSGSGPG